jgi:hypothetical protein
VAAAAAAAAAAAVAGLSWAAGTTGVVVEAMNNPP